MAKNVPLLEFATTILYNLGIGIIQQTTNMHTVGAVHERPGSTRSVFRIRLAHTPDAASAAGRFVNRPYYFVTVNTLLFNQRDVH